jgi:hypothetical protein
MTQQTHGRLALILIVVTTSSRLSCCWGDDFATWHGVDARFLDTTYVDLVSSAEFRLYDDSQFLRQVLLRQAVKSDPWESFQFNVHYLLQSVRASSDWQHAHVLGTRLSVSF